MSRSGWFRESYRHYLSAKGISTAIRRKNRKFKSKVDKLGVGKDFYVDSKTGLVLAAVKGGKGETAVSQARLDELGKQDRIEGVSNIKAYMFVKDNVPPWNRPHGLTGPEMEILRQRAMEAQARGDKKFMFQGKEYAVVDVMEMVGGYFSKKNYFAENVDEELAKIDEKIAFYDEVLPGSSDELRARREFLLKRKKHHGSAEAGYMAKKEQGFLDTTGHETVMDYISRNVSSHNGDKLEHFKQGVKETLLSPKEDLDDEWREYTRLKYGHAERLSDDPMGRTMQRGAALFGRVLSQSNVEPLVDRGRNRDFRDLTDDILFGRRM